MVHAVAHGVSQVMFQASLWTGLLFLAGIALSNWQHALWVLVGSIVGMLVGSYHATAAARVLDPESLVDRALLDNVTLGLYGYNATLAAVALFPLEAIAYSAASGNAALGPADRSHPHAGTARADGTVRPGDLAGSGARLDRSPFTPGAGDHCSLMRPGNPRRYFSLLLCHSDPIRGDSPMNLSPQERDKLLIYLAAQVAKDRKQRGLKLNVPEATALITAELMEMAREGKSVSEIMSAGREILTRADVMNGVPELISMIQVEPTFRDGSKLVTIHEPIR